MRRQRSMRAAARARWAATLLLCAAVAPAPLRAQADDARRAEAVRSHGGMVVSATAYARQVAPGAPASISTRESARSANEAIRSMGVMVTE